MSEDLPDPESRVMVDGERIVLQWRRTNMAGASSSSTQAEARAARRPAFRSCCRAPFDKRTPVAPVRHGPDRRTTRRPPPLDPFCRAFDHPNLFVVDAGFLPTSAAVNPALTIAAQALRVADHIRATELSR